MKFAYIATALFSTFVASAPADREPNEESSITLGGGSATSEFHIMPNLGTSISGHSNAGQTDAGVLREQLQTSLDELFKSLAGYTGGMLFSFGKFEIDAASLEAKLSYTKRMIELLNPLNYQQLVQVRFAELVYQDMLTALSLYRAFPDTAGQDYAILRNLVQTNVCLFTLRDHNGTPDSSIKDYNSIVRGAMYGLNQSMSMYGKNGKVSSTLDQVVKIQHNRVQNTISELKAASIHLILEG